MEELPEEEPMKALLRDGHPLLERFQETLRTHLVRVKTKLEEECASLENTLRDRAEEQAEVGASLYDVQQQLNHQRRQLGDLAQEIETATDRHRELQAQVEVARKESEVAQCRLQVVSQKHQENLVTVASLHDLANHIDKWHVEAGDALKVAHRITKKDAQERAAQVEAKRKLDVFILTLEAEVRRGENELNQINEQIKDSAVYLEKFHRNLTDANAACEALQHEQRRLMQSWGEVIVAVQQRDKVLAAVTQELHGEYERHKDLRGHLEGAKKEIQWRSVHNEKLEGFVNQLTGDLLSLDRHSRREAKEMEKVSDAYGGKQTVYEQTEADLKQASLEGVLLDNQLKAASHKIELQAKSKLKLEEQILNLLQEQISSDKAGQYRAGHLRENQDRRRSLEVQITTTENQLSVLLLDLERARGSVVRYQEMQEKFQRDETELESILDKQETNCRDTLARISTRQLTLDTLATQLEGVVNALGGRELSPEESRVMDLNRDSVRIDGQLNELQSAWLKLQQHLVQLNEKRSRQTNEIYIARKQDLIIAQKNRKVEIKLSGLSLSRDSIGRSLLQLNHQIQFLAKQVFSKGATTTVKEAECNRNFDRFYERLRSSEKHSLDVEAEIEHLERGIQTLRDSVVERHREICCWQGKYQAIRGVKRFQDQEASVDGEMYRMKMEIHRMEVRLAQLKRAQEKLVQDLNNCVMHRERIFDQSLVQSKGPRGRNKRMDVQQKMLDMKSRTRQLVKDCACTEKTVGELSARQQDVERELRRKLYESESERQKANQIREQTEEAQLMRHANLEAIVRCQRRAKRFKAILMDAYPPKYRSEASIENRMERYSEIQDQLQSFLNSLLGSALPNQSADLRKILQTLQR